MQAQQIPAFIAYIQALGVPIIALLGVWLAARQALIAEERLKFDVFNNQYDRRFAVYNATREAMASVFEKIATEEKLAVFTLRALDARFIFNDSIYKYLMEIHHHLQVIIRADRENEGHDGGARDGILELRATSIQWIIAQGDDSGLPRAFAPFLTYAPPPRAWWLRWP